MHSPRPSQLRSPPPEEAQGEDAAVWKEEATTPDRPAERLRCSLQGVSNNATSLCGLEGRLFESTAVNQDFSKKPGANMRPSVFTTL